MSLIRITLVFIAAFVAAYLTVHHYYLYQGQLLPQPIAILADGAVYSGNKINGLPEGQGQLLWANGDRYNGDFKAGLMSGQGQLIRSGIYDYQGDFIAGQMHGKGLMITPTYQYEGEFERGVMSGQGVLIMGETRYTGAFKNNLMHGYGEIVYSEQESYKGFFVNHKYEGVGKLIRSKGEYYEGEFKAGYFHGQGHYKQSNGAEYIGQFVNGQFTGQGEYKNNYRHYKGDFIDWVFKGEGVLSNEYGQYTGTFENGQLVGVGVFAAHNGARYEGGFAYGEYDGMGTYTDPKGNVYKGAFSAGHYHGEGQYTRVKPLDGIRSFAGTWRYGKLLSHDQEPRIFNDTELGEGALYNQNEMLEKQFARLQKSQPDKVEVFALLVAGDGKEEVFRREIEFVSQHLSSQVPDYRQLRLINTRRSIDRFPLATKHSIQLSLQALSTVMGSEDILFVYMSSHGSKQFDFSLRHQGVALADLPAKQFAKMLKALPVKHKVIVVSSCYSGGYIDLLKEPATLVITASAGDRNSFGCADDNEMTWFGRAYFEGSLKPPFDFIAAYHQAKPLVSQWEQEQGYKASLPQISCDEHIYHYLAKHVSGTSQPYQASFCEMPKGFFERLGEGFKDLLKQSNNDRNLLNQPTDTDE